MLYYKIVLTLWLNILLLTFDACQAGYMERHYPASVLEDVYLDMFGLTHKYHYPLESHYVTTEDKYILQLFRLPRPKARPVFLMHGILDSSITWILNGPWSALDASFWSFSWHEIGFYDLPASIDYVLNANGYEKLAYVGHSQTMTPVYLAHLPSGANLKQITHYVQLTESRRFCQYDYGPTENQRRYNNTQPPAYPLKKVATPVALYYAYNDNLSSYKDVMHLPKELPNVVENHLYPDKRWNHVTMVWGLNARELAHKHLVKVMRKFEV